MSELEPAGPNAEQITYWNAAAGPVWVAMQVALDHQLDPLGERAIEALAPAAGERIIDVGCGCGSTSMALAARVGPSGRVLGVDISEPMLAVARGRAAAAGLEQAAFALADAQTHAFAPADAMFSRFGVMFFADPAAAFANIRKALGGGRLTFVCWRAFADNPWMFLPMAAALPLLPAPPEPPSPDAPGPFAFADRDKVAGILRQAGFGSIQIEPHDQPIGWPDLDEAVGGTLNVGPLGRVVREHPTLAEPIRDAVRAALAAHAGPDGVKLASATWIVKASR